MAEVQRYVDTASSGGDGTTQGHSGATAAYASLSSWEANEAVDLVAAGDTHVVDCAGSTADTTAVTVSGWTTDATHTITIRGDRAAPDGDGFYDGKSSYSTSHYRLEVTTTGSVARALILVERDVIIDGIQVGIDTDAQFSFGIWASTQVDRVKVLRCRVFDLNAASPVANTQGIRTDGSQNNITVDSCLTVGFANGMLIQFQAFGTGDLFIYNNTCVEASGVGIFIDNDDTGSNHDAAIKNNVCHSNGGNDYTNSTWASGTVTLDTNFFEDGLATTNEVDISDAAASVFASPGTTAASDWSPLDDGPLDPAVNAGIEIGEATDVTDTTRSTPFTGGAHHFVNAAGGGGRIMSSLAGAGGLAGMGGLASRGGGLAGAPEMRRAA